MIELCWKAMQNEIKTTTEVDHEDSDELDPDTGCSLRTVIEAGYEADATKLIGNTVVFNSYSSTLCFSVIIGSKVYEQKGVNPYVLQKVSY